jgi:hypothetical protein
MLRFLPDSVAEGLLRPFFMADPVAGLYLEDTAPDLRFAAFLLILGVAVFMKRRALPLTTGQGVTVIGTVLLLYVWTFASGNGRYFTWGLLLVGPLLVMACALLPASKSARWGILSLVLLLQLSMLGLSRVPNLWASVRTTEVPLALNASPLREQPAVFLTVSKLSYSILVPLFHPQSRWANIAGQYNILPGTPEWTRLQTLLRDPLPKYLVTPVRPKDHDPQGQPFGQTRVVLDNVLSHQGLQLVVNGCKTLWSLLSGPGPVETEELRAKRGFWLCALEPRPLPTDVQPATADGRALAIREAMDAVERRCPRFFPPGGGQPSLVDGAHLRDYAMTDVRLWVIPEDLVLFQYFRAMNPTVLGPFEDVRAGRFTVPCDKLPGRYLPFWQRP